MTEQQYNFDEIRPFHNDEVKAKVRELIKDPVFDEVLMHMFKNRPKVEMVKTQLRMVRSVRQLQGTFVYDLLRSIVNKTSDGLFCRGLEKIEKKKPYLFISNHRDIILDSALLNYLIFEKGLNTTRIAIGDNLLLYRWIELAVKLNRSFVIKRDLGVRELLESSKKVSHFIRHSITEEKKSVWIAQREGRTKDGNDQTQLSVLKMLNMSNDKSFSKGFNELNIIPLSISYEIEPCALTKMIDVIKKEHYHKMRHTKDDLKSMSMGMFAPKGRMYFAFGNPIKVDMEDGKSAEEKNNNLKQLATLIDNQIYKNFKLYPSNYVAYDMLMQEHRFKHKYTLEEEKTFKMLLKQAMIYVDFPITDLQERFLKVYANPVINKLKVVDIK